MSINFIICYLVEYEKYDCDLQTALKTQKPGVETRLRICESVLKGIKAIHDAGIIHGDIKPANILVNMKNGVLRTTFIFSGPEPVVISDMGLSKEVTNVSKTMEGTPIFVSPEQAAGPRHPKSDIYSVGIVISTLLFRHNAYLKLLFDKRNMTEESKNDQNLITFVKNMMKVSLIFTNFIIYKYNIII